MKKLLLCTLLLFCFILPAWSTNFVEFYRNEDYFAYFDVDSIEMRTEFNHKYLVAWEKWIPRGEGVQELEKEYGRPVDFFMQFSAYNMERKQYQRLSFHAYDKNGQILGGISREFYTFRYEEIIPGTLGEDMYNFIMSRYKKK